MESSTLGIVLLYPNQYHKGVTMSLKDLYESRRLLKECTAYDISDTQTILEHYIAYREKMRDQFEEFLRNHLCPTWGYGGSLMCNSCKMKDLCDYIDQLMKDEQCC